MAVLERKLSRKEIKAQSRKRLVDAIILVLRRDGPGGLTTGKVAREAGLSQPSFYVHFKDMEEALTAAADELGRQIRDILASERRRIGAQRSRETMIEAFASTLNAFLSNPTLSELILRYRRDEATPIGKVARSLLLTLRSDMMNDFRSMGLDESKVPRLDVFVDLVMGMIIGVVESFLDGRLTEADTSACADALFRGTVSLYMALAS